MDSVRTAVLRPKEWHAGTCAIPHPYIKLTGHPLTAHFVTREDICSDRVFQVGLTVYDAAPAKQTKDDVMKLLDQHLMEFFPPKTIATYSPGVQTSTNRPTIVDISKGHKVSKEQGLDEHIIHFEYKVLGDAYNPSMRYHVDYYLNFTLFTMQAVYFQAPDKEWKTQWDSFGKEMKKSVHRNMSF